jgi:hypothetical protein
MATMQDLIADARRMAYGSLGDQINVVATAYTANATSLVLDMDVSNITQGMMLSGGLNVWYVKGTDVASKTVYVIPGYDNSPKKNLAVGTFVYIKPRVTDWFLFEQVNGEIIRLSSPENGLYKIAIWETEVDPTWQTYAVPTAAFNMIGLLRLRFRMPGSSDVWIDIPEKAYRVQFNPTAGDSYIRILRNIPSGTDIQFVYKAPFTKAEELDDDVVDVCGLTDTMLDLPALGALSTLLRTTESRRMQVQQQGDARRSSEVSGGYNLQTSQVVEREYRSRIMEEMARLTQRVPFVRSL